MTKHVNTLIGSPCHAGSPSNMYGCCDLERLTSWLWALDRRRQAELEMIEACTMPRGVTKKE